MPYTHIIIINFICSSEVSNTGIITTYHNTLICELYITEIIYWLILQFFFQAAIYK